MICQLSLKKWPFDRKSSALFLLHRGSFKIRNEVARRLLEFCRYRKWNLWLKICLGFSLSFSCENRWTVFPVFFLLPAANCSESSLCEVLSFSSRLSVYVHRPKLSRSYWKKNVFLFLIWPKPSHGHNDLSEKNVVTKNTVQWLSRKKSNY